MIPEAGAIVAKALLDGKKLAVWGDYDVDGITATTLALDVLEFHGFKPLHHLPDRRSEGYGLNCENIRSLAESGCQILLTVDCGVGNPEAVACAKELGLKVIVCDHHLPAKPLPEADAIVDPRMEEAGLWPCIHLAGVGVAFYVLAEVNRLLSASTGKFFKMDNVLDLVALGTLADVMALEGENRPLVAAGLNMLASPARPGLAALKMVSGFEPGSALNSNQAVFRLAPRINAAGRMGSPDLALDLLRCKDFSEAIELARMLDDCNTRRKTEEARIFDLARKQAQELLDARDYGGLVLAGEDWHPGIVGIVASRIVEEFNRPAIVLYQDDGSFKGSGRSVLNFDLHDALQGMAGLLLGFGGHKQAAGVSVAAENLEEFRKQFSQSVKRVLGNLPPPPTLILDGGLPFSHASNPVFVRELDLMQPFGPGNEEPVFASMPVEIVSRRLLGHTGEHVLLVLREVESGREMKAKAWRMAKELHDGLIGKTIRIAYTPEIDVYNGIANISLLVKDWQKA